MTRMVMCKKYGKELPALTKVPYPGEKGQEIYDTVSKQAWLEWQKLQTMLINEKQLNMFAVDDRKYLQEQMMKFLNNEDHATASGYVPPSE